MSDSEYSWPWGDEDAHIEWCNPKSVAFWIKPGPAPHVCVMVDDEGRLAIYLNAKNLVRFLDGGVQPDFIKVHDRPLTSDEVARLYEDQGAEKPK